MQLCRLSAGRPAGIDHAMPETIRIGPVEAGVATIVLSRPEKKNALSITLRDEMSDAVDSLVHDALQLAGLDPHGRRRLRRADSADIDRRQCRQGTVEKPGQPDCPGSVAACCAHTTPPLIARTAPNKLVGSPGPYQAGV